MKPIYVLPLALIGAALASPIAAQAPARTIIHAGQLLAEPGKPVRGASTIIVEGGKIVSITEGYQPADPGATLIDLKDKYVLPGLIDSHVHLTSDAGGIAGQLEEVTLSPAAQAFNAEANGMKTLRAGFTTVRNLGDGDGATVDLALNGARNGQTAVPGARQGEEALSRQRLAELHAASVDEDELPLIGADHVAVRAAHAQEAQAHFLKPRGAELDLRLIAGDHVHLRRGLAVLGRDDVIADALVARRLDRLLAATGDSQAQEAQDGGGGDDLAAHRPSSGN